MKIKEYEVTLFDKKETTLKTDAPFFTTDTDAWLKFEVVDEGFSFSSATIALINLDDGSVVLGNMEVEEKEALFHFRTDVIEHAGRWTVQVIFNSEGLDYTALPIRCEVKSYVLSNKKPPIYFIEDISVLIKLLETMRINFEEESERIIAELVALKDQQERGFSDLKLETEHYLEEVKSGTNDTIQSMIIMAESAIKVSEENALQSANVAKKAMEDFLSMVGKDIPTLDANGKLSSSQIPALAINDTFVVNNISEITALVAQRGDVAIRIISESVSDAYILTMDEPSVLSNWVKLGVSYVAESGHSQTATNAKDAERINGHRVVTMTQAEYDISAKDADTVYLVGG